MHIKICWSNNQWILQKDCRSISSDKGIPTVWFRRISASKLGTRVYEYRHSLPGGAVDTVKISLKQMPHIYLSVVPKGVGWSCPLGLQCLCNQKHFDWVPTLRGRFLDVISNSFASNFSTEKQLYIEHIVLIQDLMAIIHDLINMDGWRKGFHLMLKGRMDIP